MYKSSKPAYFIEKDCILVTILCIEIKKVVDPKCSFFYTIHLSLISTYTGKV
jgi:hypothetical protein